MNYHKEVQAILTHELETGAYIVTDAGGMRVRHEMNDGTFTTYTIAVGVGYLIRQRIDKYGRVINTYRLNTSGGWDYHD